MHYQTGGRFPPLKEILRGISNDFRHLQAQMGKSSRKAALLSLMRYYLSSQCIWRLIGLGRELVVPGIFEERHEARELLLVLPDQRVDVLMGGSNLFVLFVERGGINLQLLFCQMAQLF